MGAVRCNAAALIAALAVVLLPLTAGCVDESPAPTAEVTADEVTALVAGGNEFAFDIYGRLAGRGNLFFSPYSISTALAMTAAGARGETESEMAATLHFPVETVDGVETQVPRERIAATYGWLQHRLAATPETRGYELSVANSLWGQEGYPFRESFLGLIDSGYGGGFNIADFAGNVEAERLRINGWVMDETHDRIEDLIPQGGVDALTTLVLVNAVYFKGQWAAQFDAGRTSDATFHGESRDGSVPMMFRKGDYRYYSDEDVQLIEMPYTGDEVSMLVVLPRAGSLMTLSALEGALSPQMLEEWSANLHEEEVKVYFPRFEMTWGTEDISGHLQALGMRLAFTAGADFTGMSDRRDLFIGPVFHKAFVSVNEEGTEAAAATAVVMKREAVMDTPEFRADHPFMFFIRENATGEILFMGRVTDLG